MESPILFLTKIQLNKTAVRSTKGGLRGVRSGHLIMYRMDQSEHPLIVEFLTHPAILQEGQQKKFTISSTIE